MITAAGQNGGRDHGLYLTHEEFMYVLRLVQRDVQAHLVASRAGEEGISTEHMEMLAGLATAFLGPEGADDVLLS